MGDTTIAQDILEGVADALGSLGDTRSFRVITIPSVDVNNPGATPVETESDTEVEALLFDFDQEYMAGANILEGGLMSIISIEGVADATIAEMEPGNRLVDGSTIYEIVRVQKIEVAGIIVAVIVQLKG